MRLDTTVALRALAILFVVASHVDLVALEGGAHLLLGLAGFQLRPLRSRPAAAPRHADATRSAWPLIVPSMLWWGGVAALLSTCTAHHAVRARTVDGTEWDNQSAAVGSSSHSCGSRPAPSACLPVQLHRLERRTPFVFALVVLAVVARFAEVSLAQPRSLVVAFFFVLGWAGARAKPPRNASSSQAWPRS